MHKKLFTYFLITFFLVCAFNNVYAKKVEYHLIINKKTVNILSKPLDKIVVNGTLPAPILEFNEGDEAVIHVKNHLNEDTSIHWHGLLLAGKMDGVPTFNSFQSIKPHQTFTYHFKIRQSGTYWYHAHTEGQEQDGHYGAIVIHPKKNNIEQTQKDYVVLISDFHKQNADEIMRNLKMSADYYQNQRRTLGDFFNDLKRDGVEAVNDATMWGQMRMLKTDLSDVTGYHFLVNGKIYTNNKNENFLYKQGDKVRLRFINGSAMSFYDVRIPHLKMTVVAADGQDIEPVTVDEFRFGVGETYDVIVEPKNGQDYTIETESIDRSGFALATLSTKSHAIPTIPHHRKRAELTMADMGHDDMRNMDHTQMNHNMDMMDHAAMGHDMPVSNNSMISGWDDADTPKGYKALEYKDLKALHIHQKQRSIDRVIKIELDGNMERYIWTLNGKKFSDAETIVLNYGERVRFDFVNKSMMAHPMHLHGLFMQLDNGQSEKNMPNKHTIIVPPAKTVSAYLTANEVGEWAFHCHLLYHMASGMMTKLVVKDKL
jgi:CopA family copper-resistance protein